jgi:hypothetical protein
LGFFKPGQEGKAKGGSLTGASLGNNDQIFIGFDGCRNGLSLDRRRLFEAQGLEGVNQRLWEAQL